MSDNTFKSQSHRHPSLSRYQQSCDQIGHQSRLFFPIIVPHNKISPRHTLNQKFDYIFLKITMIYFTVRHFDKEFHIHTIDTDCNAQRIKQSSAPPSTAFKHLLPTQNTNVYTINNLKRLRNILLIFTGMSVCCPQNKKIMHRYIRHSPRGK